MNEYTAQDEETKCSTMIGRSQLLGNIHRQEFELFGVYGCSQLTYLNIRNVLGNNSILISLKGQIHHLPNA